MKKILFLGLILTIVFAFSACGADDMVEDGLQNNGSMNSSMPNSSNTSSIMESMPNGSVASPGVNTPADSSSKNAVDTAINRDKAIEIAISEAGLKKADVYEIEAELEHEYAELVWEVDFETRATEYTFLINAQTGKVVHRETERND